jgi:hypothetical protein
MKTILKTINLATLLAVLYSCSEAPSQVAKTSGTPPAKADDATIPTEVTGGFVDLACGADTPGIVCKIRQKGNSEVFLDQFEKQPEFELLLSMSSLPKREDDTTVGVQKITAKSASALTKWGLVIDADEAAVNKLITFFKSGITIPTTTIGIVFKDPTNAGGRVIASLDRCTFLSFLKEWGINPASDVNNTPGTLPTSVRTMLQSQSLVNIALALAVKSQNLNCFPSGPEGDKKLLELKKTFSDQMLAATKEWFIRTNNRIKPIPAP